MIYIILLFILHWFVSVFFQTAFLHRYASHKMFTMGKIREKIFHFMTWLSQGPSYLVPRAYAVMHRMHHEFSDTEEDPHSPHFFKDIFSMMIKTKEIYTGFSNNKISAASKYYYDLPVWKKFESFADHYATRLGWGLVYIAVYLLLIWQLDLSYFWMLLLPVHFLMGPIHGAIVNWCGHKYGYKNFDNHDNSRNTEPFGILLMGELFQNNHHKFPASANFAKKWFEFDPTYYVLVVMHYFGIIKLVKTNK
ncbi:MAG: acyl-CoA desaturase [Bacteroidota bacterium]|nr:acyl-CoA desaturase [Bacteroidota bacterium]